LFDGFPSEILRPAHGLFPEGIEGREDLVPIFVLCLNFNFLHSPRLETASDFFNDFLSFHLSLLPNYKILMFMSKKFIPGNSNSSSIYSRDGINKQR